MAVGQGFEPWRACTLAVFKTAALNRSAIPPRGEMTLQTPPRAVRHTKGYASPYKDTNHPGEGFNMAIFFGLINKITTGWPVLQILPHNAPLCIQQRDERFHHAGIEVRASPIQQVLAHLALRPRGAIRSVRQQRIPHVHDGKRARD